MEAEDRPLEMFTPPPSPCKASTGSGQISTINFWIGYITFSIPIGLKKAADKIKLQEAGFIKINLKIYLTVPFQRTAATRAKYVAKRSEPPKRWVAVKQHPLGHKTLKLVLKIDSIPCS